MQTIYVTEVNDDPVEGRGAMVPIGYFLHRDLALHAAIGRGVMGVGDAAYRDRLD